MTLRNKNITIYVQIRILPFISGFILNIPTVNSFMSLMSKLTEFAQNAVGSSSSKQ